MGYEGLLGSGSVPKHTAHACEGFPGGTAIWLGREGDSPGLSRQAIQMRVECYEQPRLLAICHFCETG